MIRLMNSKQSGPINIGNPDEFTIKQLAKLVRDQINPELQILTKPLPEDDPLKRQPMIELAKRELKWEPSIQLREGLEKTINYFRDSINHDKTTGKD